MDIAAGVYYFSVHIFSNLAWCEKRYQILQVPHLACMTHPGKVKLRKRNDSKLFFITCLYFKNLLSMIFIIDILQM